MSLKIIKEKDSLAKAFSFRSTVTDKIDQSIVHPVSHNSQWKVTQFLRCQQNGDSTFGVLIYSFIFVSLQII